MKLFTTCMVCLKELGYPSFEPIIADYFDGATAIIECARGHKSAVILQGQKFEILFESGASALLEGYTIEAASSFSASLERFYEFCIRVFRIKDGLNEIEFAKTFKEMAHQSERQFGVFLYLYLQNFGKAYQVKHNLVTFRNKVVHKGYIPTIEEAESYGAQIFDEICDVYTLLKSAIVDDITKAVFAEMWERGKNLPSNMPRATLSQSSFFSFAQDSPKASFKEALVLYKERQEMLGKAIPEMSALNKMVNTAINTTPEAHNE